MLRTDPTRTFGPLPYWHLYAIGGLFVLDKSWSVQILWAIATTLSWWQGSRARRA